MNYEEQLRSEGITLSTKQFIPSLVKIDAEEVSKYSAFVFATGGSLAIRLFDGTSTEIDPSYFFNDKQIEEIRLNYTIAKKGEQTIYDLDGYKEIRYVGGLEEDFKLLDGRSYTTTSLVGLAKIIFVDLLRLMPQETNNEGYTLT